MKHLCSTPVSVHKKVGFKLGPSHRTLSTSSRPSSAHLSAFSLRNSTFDENGAKSEARHAAANLALPDEPPLVPPPTLQHPPPLVSCRCSHSRTTFRAVRGVVPPQVARRILRPRDDRFSLPGLDTITSAELV